jgi:hypothetical protein
MALPITQPKPNIWCRSTTQAMRTLPPTSGAAVAKQTRRGWRLQRPGQEPIDAVIALASRPTASSASSRRSSSLGWL